MSYLIDTCVLSELVKPKADANVVEWIESHDELQLFLSVITIGEIHKGIANLPESPRRAMLEHWVETDLASRFEHRILPIDSGVAVAWGVMLSEALRRGTQLPVIDTLIAATAKVHRCAVVTRNEVHLLRTGVEVINPW